jgi:hypothetical protein
MLNPNILAQEKVASVPKAGGRRICMAEIEQHADKNSAWFVRDGKVRLPHSTIFQSEIRRLYCRFELHKTIISTVKRRGTSVLVIVEDKADDVYVCWYR